MTPQQAERVAMEVWRMIYAVRDRKDQGTADLIAALTSNHPETPDSSAEAVRLLRLVHSARVPIPVGLAQEIMVFLSSLDHPKGGE